MYVSSATPEAAGLLPGCRMDPARDPILEEGTASDCMQPVKPGSQAPRLPGCIAKEGDHSRCATDPRRWRQTGASFMQAMKKLGSQPETTTHHPRDRARCAERLKCSVWSTEYSVPTRKGGGRSWRSGPQGCRPHAALLSRQPPARAGAGQLSTYPPVLLPNIRCCPRGLGPRSPRPPPHRRAVRSEPGPLRCCKFSPL